MLKQMVLYQSSSVISEIVTLIYIFITNIELIYIFIILNDHI